MTDRLLSASHSGAFAIGGTISVNRLGYGAVRITGPGIWGDPPDRGAAVRLLRRAVDLGVNFIDTADSYGPYVSEQLIKEALHPYRDVTIATKGGLVRPRPGEWVPIGNPAYLRQCVEMSLCRLGVDSIALYQLHRIDPDVPLIDQLGTLDDMRREGKITHVGLSQVSVAEICQARLICPVASVQSRFNASDRESEEVLDYCERENLAFIPWSPVAAGRLAVSDSPLAMVASQLGVRPTQVALAWLLRRSPVMLPIPGTTSADHLEENVAAASIELTSEHMAAISTLV